MKTITTLLFLSLVTLLQAQVAINTNTPDKSAMLDVTSSNKGFLPPRLDQNDVDGMVEPATGLMVYNSTEKCIQVNIGTPTDVNWQCLNGTGSAATASAGVPNGACTLEQVPQDISTTVVDLPPSPTTKRVWMDRNLGASGPVVIGDDSTYGDLYQWGRGADGHQLASTTNITNTAITHIPGHGDFILGQPWTRVNGVCFAALYQNGNDPCPDGYRIPTEAEFTAEIPSSYSNADANTHWRTILKFAPGGFRTSSRVNRGSYYGYYFSEPTTNPVFPRASDGGIQGPPSHFVEIDGNDLDWKTENGNDRGHSIRCIKEQQ